jgi:3-oxoacyl-[acyl-carrier protein] reductase
MNLQLKNKTAIVTGGSKGIGKAIAKALATEGANVVICGRGLEALSEARNEIEQVGGKVIAVQADLSNQEDVERLVSETVN